MLLAALNEVIGEPVEDCGQGGGNGLPAPFEREDEEHGGDVRAVADADGGEGSGGDAQGGLGEGECLAPWDNQSKRAFDEGMVAPTLNHGAGMHTTPTVLVPTAPPRSYCLQGNMIGRSDGNGPNGPGVSEELSFTLDTVDRHAVASMAGGGDPRVQLDAGNVAAQRQQPEMERPVPHAGRERQAAGGDNKDGEK